jgi:hypothetical protein
VVLALGVACNRSSLLFGGSTTHDGSTTPWAPEAGMGGEPGGGGGARSSPPPGGANGAAGFAGVAGHANAPPQGGHAGSSGAPALLMHCSGGKLCAARVSGFPRYFLNHPDCPRLESCAATFERCPASCPLPSAEDAIPPPPVPGHPNGWPACNGEGNRVHARYVAGHGRYFQNHPGCILDTSDAPAQTRCSLACGAPTESDLTVAWPKCFQGRVCRGLLKDYPSYFLQHFACVATVECSDATEPCPAECPPPTGRDALNFILAPPLAGSEARCALGNTLGVCVKDGWPSADYFERHPACTPVSDCSEQAACNAACPSDFIDSPTTPGEPP